jgi:hypothetical protein
MTLFDILDDRDDFVKNKLIADDTVELNNCIECEYHDSGECKLIKDFSGLYCKIENSKRMIFAKLCKECEYQVLNYCHSKYVCYNYVYYNEKKVEDDV